MIVHDVKQVGFDLRSYVNGLDKKELDIFVNAFVVVDLSQIDFGKNGEHRQEWLADNAKTLIFRYAVFTMALAYLRKETAEAKRETDNLRREFVELVRAKANLADKP
jgi:3-methyladenine DNA glycosylase AlkD